MQLLLLFLPLCTAPTLPWRRSLAVSSSCPSCCRLQIRQVSSQAWEPTLRSKQPGGGGGGRWGGEKSCSRRHRRGGGGGVASVGRCVPYRHDNRLRGSRLLPRFRRLTLHSGYDGWSDSAPKNQEGPSCRLACLPGERAPPGGQDVKLHPRENNTGNMAVSSKGSQIYKVVDDVRGNLGLDCL